MLQAGEECRSKSYRGLLSHRPACGLITAEHDGYILPDVGANIGCQTLPFGTARHLCADFALNALRNVVVTCAAGVAKDSGWMHLPVFDPRQQDNFAEISMADHESGPLTRVLKIDELRFARCTLHIDVWRIFKVHDDKRSRRETGTNPEQV